ncbi:Pentatricopeptide repeat [Parasponia andersonii]|uniref:Pentatricopeptide repeat n=1 Tax=Parasponia andersonii TaxID=3476 RepID=A0A2P5A7B8_PARAD|nr:Pentatricopeptide repeat [Parasponia andersonii]
MKPFGTKPWCGYGISRVFRALFYSSEALTSSSPPPDTLYRRISRLGNPKISMTPVLNQWVEQGKDVNASELHKIIKQLRKYRRFTQALQDGKMKRKERGERLSGWIWAMVISEWMSQMNYALSSGDIAIRLDLISKVYGLDQAEEYFNSIPESSRVDKIHGALLNCYAEKKSLEKAEDIFQKMKELGFIEHALTYNVMLSLYSRMGKHEKLRILIQEMEENGIKYDKFTFNIWLNAYAVTLDIEGMEKLLSQMEADHEAVLDFHSYFIAANGYLKAGLPEKAWIKLKRSEQVIGSKERKIAYEHLLTLYAATGKKEEVYRIWNLYKDMGRVYNSGYLSVLSSLVKLDDIDGAEKILEEWESANTLFDNRIANLLISTYCKKGHLEKAFALVERVVISGKELDGSIWQCLATHCRLNGQMAKAVESMKKAVSANGSVWKFSRSTFAACLEYLKKEGDLEAAHEISGLLRERGLCSNEIYNRLVDYLNSDKDSGALDAMEGG